MKKKTMRLIFVLLFLFGIIIGYLLPGDVKVLTASPLKTSVFDVPKKFGQLENENEYLKYTELARTESGSVTVVRIDGKIPKHLHPKESHIIYILRGKGRVLIGAQSYEVGAGQLVIIPASTPHDFERTSESPVEMLLFSTPSSNDKDVVFLDSGKGQNKLEPKFTTLVNRSG